MEVALYDIDDEALVRAEESIGQSLKRFVAKEVLTPEEAAGVVARITMQAHLEDSVDGASVVVEAVPENLALKQQVIAEAVESAPVDAILATNTSQLSITAIGEHLEAEAERLIGTHFLNPPVLMKLVEIMRGPQTSDATVEAARAFVKRLGREAVVVQRDSPGFITTRVSAIARLECLRMLEEGVATADDIDKACRLGLNYPMGPIELGDFNGLDTYLSALDSLSDVYGERFQPTTGLRDKVAGGQLGRKSGAGYFRYDEAGKRVSET